jgi:hypothetical protein
VADAHVSRQPQHVPLLKYVSDQSVVLALMELVTVAGDDPRGVLTAVLEHRQGVVQRLIYVGLSNEADNAAHNGNTWSDRNLPMGERIQACQRGS